MTIVKLLKKGYSLDPKGSKPAGVTCNLTSHTPDTGAHLAEGANETQSPDTAGSVLCDSPAPSSETHMEDMAGSVSLPIASMTHSESVF